MKQETFRKIVSGSDSSVTSQIFRVVLGAAALLYGGIIAVRNRLYDTGILKSYSVNIPVICIGNLTTGGTGKTPLVIWLCGYLRKKGLKCVILTRGYRTHSGSMTDEPALLAKACSDVPVVVDSDRVRGAQRAIEQYQPQILILDDGFQHRRLRRDLDIVAIDATCPFGYGRLLPAGLLREPLKALKRASAVVITRTNQVKPEQVQAIEQRIREFVPDVSIAKTVHRQHYAVTIQNQKIGLDELKHQPVYAFCGIGNPDAFFLSLRQGLLNIVGTKVFDDHHAYTIEEMKEVFNLARQCGAGAILCTQKDWVKSALLAPQIKNFVFAYLAMELDFVEGFDTISRTLDHLVETQGNNVK